ncbi:endo-1,4-beta-xylanase [Bacteroides sp. 51]|uniref:endo-1,4-beta-xylanase n=1 Tax=Bacteroides sp. 51 TaxID=2302938 RepID=UPI0013D8B08B|nr:endo-1,4-beta-xylanase [Bacteroides sp. 51]NDV81618.1 hypothetical protein [Bacteroides sp. 51]
MKYINKLFLVATASALLISCADLDYKSDLLVEKPDDVAKAEYLNSFDLLKSYITKDNNSPFKLATFISPTAFEAKELAYSTVLNNFEGIDVNGAFLPVDMQNTDGTCDFNNVNSIGRAAKDAGITIYGGTLCSNQGQPAAYLNKLIEPTVIHHEMKKGTDKVLDFEEEVIGTELMSIQKDASKKYNTRIEKDPVDGNNKTVYVGPNGDGYSRDYYLPIVRVKLPDGKTLADYQSLSFDAYFTPSSNTGQFRLYFYSADGTRNQFNLEDAASLIGGITGKWQREITVNLQKESLTAPPYGIALPASVASLNEFDMAFGVASYSADFYLDNISFNYEETMVGEFIFADFESDNIGTTYPSVQKFGDDRLTIEVVSDPAGGDGKVVQVGPKKSVNEYHLPMFDVKLPAGKTLGDMNGITLDAYWDGSGNNGDIRVYFLPPGWTNRDQYRYQNFSLGDIVGNTQNKWVRKATIGIQGEGVCSFTISDDLKGLTEFQIAIGPCTHTPFFYLDNLGFTWQSEGGDEIIEKTDEEKKAILTPELEKWIAGMVEAGGENITIWDVISEPLDDTNNENTFNWGEYLGEKEYARVAVKTARESLESELKLFVGNTFYQGIDISGNADKLIGLVRDWEDKADDATNTTVIDGYNIRLNAVYSENATFQSAYEQEIIDLFTKFAATKRPVRLSGLSVMIEDEGGNFISFAKSLSAQRERAADFLAFIMKQYRLLIDAEYQYGISFASMTITDGGSTLCPWTSGFGRTEIYEGIVNGLKTDNAE